ncbi:MAG TPA: ABC transporter substrate-binding protein [Acidimicrobiia bacterium]|nr:ABC transporter substrate-binding protein [Acidimicrobiia bacterium]
MRKTLLAALALTMVVASCGDDDTAVTTAATTTVAPTTTVDATTTTVPAFPVTVAGVTIDERPERIVSLSATHTEILFGVGAGDRVVATDLFSNFPAAAESTEKVDAFSLNVEAVAGLDPDLVILAFDPGDAVDGLGILGIPAVLFDAPADLDGAFAQWIDVARLTGNVTEAEALVADARRRVADVQDRLPQTLRAPTYYHELDPSFFTVTSSTFFGAVYGAVGLENVADAADESGFGYPQLSPEYLVAADPDYVFLADTKCCDVTPESFADRPALGSLTAAVSDRVIAIDDDIASRWGPRVVDFVELVAAAVHPEVFAG